MRLGTVLMALALMAVLFLGLAQSIRGNSELPGAAEERSLAAMRNDERIMFWPKVLGRIMEHPLSGAGFGREAMKLASRDLIPNGNVFLWHAHNTVLNYGLAMGVPGMLALLIIFWALLREYASFWRTGDRQLRMIGACGIVLVAGVFSRNMVNDLFLRDLSILFWALNGVLLGLGCRQRLQARHAAIA